MTSRAVKGAQLAGRDERAIRSLVNMLEEKGLEHTLKLLTDAIERVPRERYKSWKFVRDSKAVPGTVVSTSTE